MASSDPDDGDGDSDGDGDGDSTGVPGTAAVQAPSHLARPSTPASNQHDDQDGDAPPGADSPDEAAHDVRLAGAMAASSTFGPGSGHSVQGAPQHKHNGAAHALGSGRSPGATGERPPVRPYTYRRPRADRRQLVGVALAVVLVLGASLAIVGFTQGSTRSPNSGRDTPTTTAPRDGRSSTTEPDGTTGAPTTAGPPDGAPDAEMDTRDTTGEQAGQPEIDRFAATDQGLGTPCGDYQRRITLVWDSTGATSAQLDGQGAPTDAQPPSGQATACRDAGPPVTYTLTVSGPGGTTFRTITV
jgi:hypothetical protein